MSVPQLFVLVSTGQNVANLPPVLELAGHGDWIVWVESDLARRENWTRGARQVLEQRGLRTAAKTIAVRQVNDPVQLAQSCREFLVEVEHGQFSNGWPDGENGMAFRDFLGSCGRGLGRTFLVCNGGNKLTPVGLLRGWERFRPVVLYGDDAPAAYWTFADGIEHAPVIRPYQRNTLDLLEILASSSPPHFVLNREEAERFWPGPPSSHLASEPYGKDDTYTSYLHKQHFEWHIIEKGEGFPNYDALALLLDAPRLDRWKRSLATLSNAGASYAANVSILREVYQASVKLAKDAALSRDRANKVPPAARIGDSFERAVASRVHTWLTKTQHPAIQSAWRMVRVAPVGKTVESAEFDILLVLKNGILWHLECKSALDPLKDLDARLLNLQKASSQLARLALCVPVLTRHAAEPWFAALHKLRERIIDLKRGPFVPFTMLNQPSSYTMSDNEGASVLWECPSLETQLAECLRGFAAR